jgi:predicted protein tyrosine phosphatase
MAAHLPDVLICSLEDAQQRWRDFEAVISIEDEGTADTFRMTDAQGRPHLILTFTDIDYDDNHPQAPARQHLHEALTFAREHAGKRIMIHCHAGRYRSAAVGLAVLADIYGPGRETEAVEALIAIRPVAAPNLIALLHADAALERNGALHRAWMAYEATDRDYGRRRQGRYVFEQITAAKHRKAARRRTVNTDNGWDSEFTDFSTAAQAP